MNNLVNVEKAGINDNDALVKMRLVYLIEDNGNITGRGKEIAIIRCRPKVNR